MLNILLTYLPFRWNNKTEKSENRNQTKMSDSKPKDASQTKDSNPQVILKVRLYRFSK